MSGYMISTGRGNISGAQPPASQRTLRGERSIFEGFPIVLAIDEDDHWWITAKSLLEAFKGELSSVHRSFINQHATKAVVGFEGRYHDTLVISERDFYRLAQLLPTAGLERFREQVATILVTIRRTGVYVDPSVEKRTREQSGERERARADGKVDRLYFTGTIKALGIKPPLGYRDGAQYGIATNYIYLGLYGLKADGLRRKLGLGKKGSIRDAVGEFDVSAIGMIERGTAVRAVSLDIDNLDDLRLLTTKVCSHVRVAMKAIQNEVV